jgi:hypothetical protein
LKEWEAKFDQQMKLEEEEEILKLERLKIKEQEKMRLLVFT